MKMKVAFITEFKRMRERLISLVTPSYAIEDPIERAQRWIAERQERDRIESERVLLAQTVEEQAERLTYLDEILRSEDTMTVTQIAADYDLQAKALNAILKGEGVQRKTGGQWVLRAKFHGKGLTKSKTTRIDLPEGREKVVVNTQWTQAGRLLIHQILTEKGISALIDRHIKNTTRNVVVLEPRRPSTITLSLRLDA
jgi:phage antirepressor YoqD-like protein